IMYGGIHGSGARAGAKFFRSAHFSSDLHGI
ncbi:hypothetical protein A2U01_0116749, partial [Trifolium medium]|nr:hypothetical protein [Trifolium medium]